VHSLKIKIKSGNELDKPTLISPSVIYIFVGNIMQPFQTKLNSSYRKMSETQEADRRK